MPTDQIKPVRPPARNVNSRRPISAAAALAEPPERQVFPPDEEPAFTRGPARRPTPVVADAVLQWASGLPTADRRVYAGWLIEAGKDEILDLAMEQAGFTQITIKHGQGNLVTHWAVETANVFLVADGVQSIGEMKDDPSRYGIAFGWHAHESGRAQSQLRCRVFLRELLNVGYAEPLLLTVKGTLTGDLITSLMRQYDVLDANAALRKAAGKQPWDLPLYAFSIPLGPGPEVTRGQGNATKTITPMRDVVPTVVTKEHLLAHWIQRPWVAVIEALLDATIAWSIAESAAIAAGDEPPLPWEQD